MTTYLSAIPAYGRDYKNKAAVLADWQAGKDFQSQGFHGYGYFSVNDFTEDFNNPTKLLGSHTEINVRYANLAKVAVLAWSDKKGWYVK